VKPLPFAPAPLQRRSLCNPFHDAGLGPLAPAGPGRSPGLMDRAADVMAKNTKMTIKYKQLMAIYR